jgi:DNA-binding transcriptional regulator YdaS (Cro superfamily)
MSRKRRVFLAVECKWNDAEREALLRAIRAAGSLRELAEKLGLTKQAVHKWKRDRIPADYIVEIERVTDVDRRELRPDLYEGMRERA